MTISRMFWLSSAGGRGEADERVRMLLRSVMRAGGQIWKARAHRGFLEWLVGWVGAWWSGTLAGFVVYMMHDSWWEERSVGMRKSWGHSGQHRVQPMSVSCSGGRERKADECRLRTWSWRILHPCGVSSMKGRPLLWSGHVES